MVINNKKQSETDKTLDTFVYELVEAFNRNEHQKYIIDNLMEINRDNNGDIKYILFMQGLYLDFTLMPGCLVLDYRYITLPENLWRVIKDEFVKINCRKNVLVEGVFFNLYKTEFCIYDLTQFEEVAKYKSKEALERLLLEFNYTHLSVLISDLIHPHKLKTYYPEQTKIMRYYLTTALAEIRNEEHKFFHYDEEEIIQRSSKKWD